MLKDVIDGLKLVADGINSVKTIAEAVRSGRDYLSTNHPGVQVEVRALIEELGRSMQLIKRASAVMTNFRFAITADTGARELARFNDYFINAKTETHLLRDHIDDLGTHCSRVREHGIKITGSATADGFAKLFAFVGLRSPEREKQLGERLDKLAYEDFALANSAEKIMDCLELALREVQDALGTGGAMYPERVPIAADLLVQYGPMFLDMEERAAEATKVIRALVSELE